MYYKWCLILYLQITSIYSAPFTSLPQMPIGLPQVPGSLPPMPVDLASLAQSQLLRQLMPIQPPMMYQRPQQPMILLIPNAPKIDDERYTKLNEQDSKLKHNTELIDEDKNAVILDAEVQQPREELKTAVVYLPNEGRYAIGTIISYIPFLPFEINVPDTISAIGNWISGIFSRPSGNKTGAVKRFPPDSVPLLVMPLSGSMPHY